MPLDVIPEKFHEAYGQKGKGKRVFVYMEIQKCMYSLPQAEILANKLLKKRLAKFGYLEMPHTPGPWNHVSRPIAFTLVFNDFRIKYVGRDHAEHLSNAIKNDYTVELDCTGGLYCGIKLEWKYEKRSLDISIPGYF